MLTHTRSRVHRWGLASFAVAIAAALVSTGRAASTEMQAFVFPQITLAGGQSARVCVTNLSDVTSPVPGLIGVLDATDTTKLVTKSTPFSLASGAGACVNLPSAPRGLGSEAPTVLVVVAFQNSVTWNATVGKAFVSSLQLREGANPTAVLTPTFLPVIQVPN